MNVNAFKHKASAILTTNISNISTKSNDIPQVFLVGKKELCGNDEKT